jgi:hypothetical protein
MAQADQTVQNATFPTVRADINNNLAALFSDNSGSTAPSVTVAFQDWIDTSGTDPVWKKRNAANNAWITIGTISASTIAFEGTLPSQTGNAGEYLTTDGTVASWAALALGATVQAFLTSGTYTPTAGKTSFLVFCTGAGGGGGGVDSGTAAGGGSGGTAIRMYTSAEMGNNATATVGAGGTAGTGTQPPGNGGTGGASIFDPAGSGLTITGNGGGGGGAATSTTSLSAGAGGETINTQFDARGERGGVDANKVGASSDGGGQGAGSFWAGGRGKGGDGAKTTSNQRVTGTAGTAGGIFILEF